MTERLTRTHNVLLIDDNEALLRTQDSGLIFWIRAVRMTPKEVLFYETSHQILDLTQWSRRLVY